MLFIDTFLMKISKDINKDIVSLNIYLLGVLSHSKDMIKDIVSFGLSMQMLLFLISMLRMVMGSNPFKFKISCKIKMVKLHIV